MVSIPEVVKNFLPGKLAWVATSSGDGLPNVTPKGTLKLLDDQHVVFADLFSLKTRKNLEENSRVAVTVVDTGTAKGYQLKGTAEVINSGAIGNGRGYQLGCNSRADETTAGRVPEAPAAIAIRCQDHGRVNIRSIAWSRRRQANRVKASRTGKSLRKYC